MKPRVTWLINSLCGLLLGWLYGGDLADAVRLRSAEVTAHLEAPNLPFALAAVVATAVGVGATLLGAVQARPGTWRGYRLMPIVTVVVLFVDLFIFEGSKPPLSSADRTALTLRSFAEAASSHAVAQELPHERAALQQLLEPFGPPPYRVKGQPLTRWQLVLKEGCTAPVIEAKGEAAGTIFYCLAANKRSAWVTAVALPVGTYFGAPQLFTRAGEPVVAEVAAPAPDEPEPGPEQAPEGTGGPPSWFETPDSGR